VRSQARKAVAFGPAATDRHFRRAVITEAATMMKELAGNSYLFGGNAPFIEEQYEAYLADPASVSENWRNYFDQIREGAPDVAHAPVIASFVQLAKSRKPGLTGVEAVVEAKQVQVLQLINAYRFLGVRQAELDPLQRQEKPYLPELDLANYGFSNADLEAEFNTGSLVGPERAKLKEIVAHLQQTYCGSIGMEYMYIADTAQKRWLQERLEGTRATPNYALEYRRHIMERLSAAETLEKYLHTKFVGQKRFSGEGGDSLIPLLDHLLQRAGTQGIAETVIGMAHRGRLGVLVNTLGKMPADLFAEFEGKYSYDLSAGDVKYHQGFSSDIATPGGPMHLTLAFNPSHLEIVNPVVEGSVRARQTRRHDAEGAQVLPILIHGDAAFAGQGVVMETMNLSQTRGYRTGGTVHIIINNQIGFTTSDPRDSRSTLYCSDVAKMVEAPIFHVNGDDPEAVLLATEIAFDFRQQFKKDVIIDMVCFRKLGHNEQDEPMVTQPLMYKRIAQHPGTRKLYADRLAAAGVLKPGEAEEMIATFRAALDKGFHTNKTILSNYKPPYTIDWSVYKGREWTDAYESAVPMKTLKRLAKCLTTIPENFKLHPRVEKIIADRKAMGEGKLAVDWGMAENLAYASLVEEGHGVRMTGQDVGRGTFFHRHAVLHDQNRERWDAGIYLPLEHISEKQAAFRIYDSVLSEEAVLGFEYGYATSEPNQLIVWEAQFGDFANGAQVVIDQFISSGEVKWGRICGLVMLLPHGYEGQGPEHSSARPERYLQLCAEHNMQVCVPSNAAQVFHLLRRQMVRQFRKPLIVMAPKSLLRHPGASSALEDFAAGQFQTVIGETERIVAKNVKRVIVCSGKVYYDLLAHRREHKIADVAILRLEQQYPFPHEDFKAQMKKFPAAREMVWCQEEPQNQGAWYRLMAYFRNDLPAKMRLYFAGRPISASPAVGYSSKHLAQQKELVEGAFSNALSAGEMNVAL
jgi:2-oxoglutarate dehydrogenase E1 component